MAAKEERGGAVHVYNRASAVQHLRELLPKDILPGAVVYKKLDGRAGVGNLDNFDLKIAANSH